MEGARPVSPLRSVRVMRNHMLEWAAVASWPGATGRAGGPGDRLNEWCAVQVVWGHD